MVKKRKSRLNKRTKTLKAKIKPFAISFAVFSIVCLIIWNVLKIMEGSFLKAEIKWEIDDKLPIAQIVLEKNIHSLIYNKYQFDKNKIKEMLEFQPWVAKAHVTDKWPSNDIKIKIESQQIAMRWENIACKNNKEPNCMGYISNNGELFVPQKIIASKTPLARSKAGQEIIMQFYKDYQSYQEEAGEMLIKSFSRTHIDKLTFKPDIKVVLGYQQKHKRLQRFLKSYKKLKTKIKKTKLQYSNFDMRYPKGFAIKYH